MKEMSKFDEAIYILIVDLLSKKKKLAAIANRTIVR